MRLAHTTKEYVQVTVTADADPTGDVVQMAFPPRREEPVENDWGLAGWVPGGPPWQAQALVGAGGDYELSPGRWDVWVRVDDGTEVPARRAGVLTVTPLPALSGPDVDDVALAVQREFGGSDVDACEEVLDEAVGDAESILHKAIGTRQIVEQVLIEATFVPGVGTAMLAEPLPVAVLARGPVHSIDQVRFKPLDSPWAVLDAAEWVQDGAAVVLRTVRGPGTAEVTYTAGITDPVALKAVGGVCVRRAARLMNKRKDDVVGTQTSSVEGSSVAYLEDEFTEAELAKLRRFRRLVAV